MCALFFANPFSAKAADESIKTDAAALLGNSTQSITPGNTAQELQPTIPAIMRPANLNGTNATMPASLVPEAAQAVYNATARPQPFKSTPTNNIYSSDQEIQNNNYVLTRLPNGLSVLVIPDDRFPLAAMRLYVHAGSAYETPKQAGISHVLEHMVFKGTAKRPNGTLAKEVEDLGGYINAATSFDYTVYLVSLPSSYWKNGLDILKDMVFNASLKPKDLEAEKKVVLAELERGEDNPDSVIFNKLQAMALAGTPYERPIIGFRETVSSFTQQDIKDYIATWYQPQSMLLVVCGQVNPDEVLAEAQKLMGGLKNTRNLALPAAISPSTLSNGPHFYTEKRPLNKVYLSACLPVPGYTSPKTPELEILAYLLGGDNTSLFYRKYKYEAQLVDDISVSLYSFERVGLLYLNVLLDESKVTTFWHKFAADLPRLSARSFSESDLIRAKMNIEDSLFRAKETLSGLASKVGTFYFQSGSMSAENDYLTILQMTTLQNLQHNIEQWFKPQALSMAAMAPQNATLPNFENDLLFAWPVQGAQNPQQAQGPQDLAQSNATAVSDEITQSTDQAMPDSNLKMEIINFDESRQVILMPDDTLPYVSLSLVFNGGDTLLGEGEQGLDDLTAATLTKGSLLKTAPQIEVFLAERAASLGASAGRQSFSLGATFPSRFSTDLFNLINEVLQQPSFANTELDREKATQIASIRAKEDQPLGLAFRELMPFLFPNQILGYYRLGQPGAVEKFDRFQVRDYWAKQIGQPWILAVCGQFNKDEVLNFAGSLPLPNEPKVIMPSAVWGDNKELKLAMPGRNQTHLLMVFKTAPALSEDNPKLELLDTILSGQGGLLFQKLRNEQSLGYTVTSMRWQTPQTGLLAFYIGTDPGSEEKAIEGFKSVIKQLQDKPLPKSVLTGAANQMEGAYYRSHQSLGSRSSEASELAVLGYPLDYNIANIAAAKKVTPAQIQALARKYLLPEQAYIVKITP